MYRRYEDPRKVHRMLVAAEERLAYLRAAMDMGEDREGEFIDQSIYVEELRERENFAWQDEEYDENYELYGY